MEDTYVHTHTPQSTGFVLRSFCTCRGRVTHYLQKKKKRKKHKTRNKQIGDRIDLSRDVCERRFRITLMATRENTRRVITKPDRRKVRTATCFPTRTCRAGRTRLSPNSHTESKAKNVRSFFPESVLR